MTTTTHRHPEGLVKGIALTATIITLFSTLTQMLLGTGWQLAAGALGLVAGSWQLLEYWDRQARRARENEGMEKFFAMYEKNY